MINRRSGPKFTVKAKNLKTCLSLRTWGLSSQQTVSTSTISGSACARRCHDGESWFIQLVCLIHRTSGHGSRSGSMWQQLYLFTYVCESWNSTQDVMRRPNECNIRIVKCSSEYQNHGQGRGTCIYAHRSKINNIKLRRFDLIKNIRYIRMRWLVQILRIDQSRYRDYSSKWLSNSTPCKPR